MEYSLNGFNNKVATLKSAEEISTGVLVTIDSEGNAVRCEENMDFFGICTHSTETAATVIVQGYVEMPYSGATPSCGYNNLVVGTYGVAVKASESVQAAKKRFVTKVDTDKKIMGFIL